MMLCRGLGYYKAGEDKGDWANVSLNAISLATKLKMFGDLRLGTNDLLARDNVAEMTFNTMTKAVPVMYNATWNLYYTDSQNVLGGTSFDYLDSWGFQNYDLVYKDGNDEFGRPTTKWGVGSVSGSNATDAKGDLVDSTVTLKTPIIEVANNSVWTYTTKVTGKKLAADIGRNTADGYTWKINGAAGKPDWTDDDTAVGGSGNGVLTQIYLDTNASGTTTANLFTIPTYVAQVSSYNNSKKELTLKNVTGAVQLTDVVTNSKNMTLTSDDFDNLDSFAKDDYVLVTEANGIIQTIKKADVVTGDVSSYVVDKNVTVDGTKYSYTKGYEGPDGNYKLNTEFELFMDDYGYVIFAKGVEADDDYLYVTKAAMTGGVAGGAEIKFIGTDGREATGIIHDDTNIDGLTGGNGSDITKVEDGTVSGKWYKFETKSGKYVLSAPGSVGVSDTVSATKDIVKNGETTVRYGDDSTDTIKGNASTVFIVKKGSTITVYTGVENVPDVKVSDNDADVSVIKDKDNDAFAKYVLIDAAKTDLSTSGSVAGERIFIVDSKNKGVSETGDNKKLYTYEAVRTGVEEKDGIISTSDSWKPGLYTDIAYDGKWVDTMIPVKGTSDDSLKRYDAWNEDIKVVNNALNVGNEILDADCKVFITDGDELTETDASGLDARYTSTDPLTGYIYTVIDNKKVIEVYVVEDESRPAPGSETTATIQELVTDKAEDQTFTISGEIKAGIPTSAEGIFPLNGKTSKGDLFVVGVNIPGSADGGFALRITSPANDPSNWTNNESPWESDTKLDSHGVKYVKASKAHSYEGSNQLGVLMMAGTTAKIEVMLAGDGVTLPDVGDMTQTANVNAFNDAFTADYTITIDASGVIGIK